MAKWKKPNGSEIETNDMDATIAYCESLDWTRLDKKTKGDPEVKSFANPKKVKAKASIKNPAANPEPMDNGD